MNSNHRVNVVRIKEVLPHTNADTLGIVQIDGYQVVVKKDEYKAGDLAVYIQPDSVVPATEPFKFLWNDREFEGEVPLKYRRITVRRFRKEYSEGLLMPLSYFSGGLAHEPKMCYGWLKEGDNVAETLGITHYEEPEPSYNLGVQGRKLTFWQRVLRFFGYKPKPFAPKTNWAKYDVESWKNFPRLFEAGEHVIVTEKIHGSNARYLFDGKKFWVGSHNRWCHPDSSIWYKAAERFPWIEAFCREWPSFTLYGEVTPTQKGYSYGFDTEVQFFAFDIRRPDGSWINKATLLMLHDVQQTVPIVYEGPYGAVNLKELAEGPSLVEGAKNIREGIVITSAKEPEHPIRGVGRAQLKLKSLKFLEKEGSNKDGQTA